MQERPACIGVIAGEADDDRLAAGLVASLRHHRPTLRFMGVAGPAMRAQGVQPLVALDKLSPGRRRSVLGRARALRDVRRRLVEQLLAARPALLVCVGGSVFSLAIARELRRAAVPTVQYAGPPAWTWRTWRVKAMASCTDQVLALYPFEAAAYDEAGIPARFVGHPLADSVPLRLDKAAARTQLRLPHGKLIVALMPGDHAAGLQPIAEIIIKAANRFFSEIKDVHFMLPATSRRSRELFESTLRLHAGGDLPLTVLFGHAHDALAAADLALVASDVACLEAALYRTPMIVAYRKETIVRWWTRRLAVQAPLSLPNRLAGARFVPEFVQQQVTPWALADALMALMRDAQARREQIDHFDAIHRMLRQDSVGKATEAVIGALEGGVG